MFNKKVYSKKYTLDHKEDKRNYDKNYYSENKGEISRKHKIYQMENKDKISKITSRWARKNPEKVKAQSLARRIHIPKGMNCQSCNNNLGKHKHHPNYSYPFNIIFLCFKCHKKIHRS